MRGCFEKGTKASKHEKRICVSAYLRICEKGRKRAEKGEKGAERED